MKQIIYVSKKDKAFSAAEIEIMIEQAQESNRQNSVTGALISVGDYFYQLLEGNEEFLNELMKKIALDSRHKDVKVLSKTDISTRDFSTWSMKFIDYSQEQDVPDMLLTIAEMSIVKPQLATGLKYIMKGQMDL